MSMLLYSSLASAQARWLAICSPLLLQKCVYKAVGINVSGPFPFRDIAHDGRGGFNERHMFVYDMA